jgi:hypothetical protein
MLLSYLGVPLMKNLTVFACYTLYLCCAVFLSACYWTADRVVENRTKLCKTNVIGIVGDAATEPYIEIRYSVADETNQGHNKTESLMVSPPYLFKNDTVYMTYEYGESYDNAGVYAYYEKLLHDYKEGGAEYLRIINHSADKEIEFFIAGAEDDFTPISDLGSGEGDGWMLKGTFPSVRYQRAPVYYLLYPERKYPYNFGIGYYYGEGDRCGDLIVTEAWTVDAVAALYRAEYNRSDTMQLFITYPIYHEEKNYRMTDYTNGVVPNWEEYRGSIFYGVIKSGEQLAGNNKLWILATRGGMFYDYLVREWLR